jgi:hypothetical protein
MPPKRPAPFLQVVKTKPQAPPVRAEDFAAKTWQSTLFARSNPSLLIFVDFEAAAETDFLTVLVAAKPRFMIDLRLVPRFDIGSINRKLVFSLFTNSGTKYFDVSGRLGVNNRRDARLNPQVLADHLRSMVFRSSGGIEGPVGFLVDPTQFEDSYIHHLVEALSPASDNGWEILKVPYQLPQGDAIVEVPPPRNLIFISHANSEDNAFTLWLGAQLACAGYEVWSDVTRLFGGEEFWDTIEQAIRHHAAKVIVVLSRKAQTKKGVLDEINCAVAVERSAGIDGFVIPVRLDDLPFTDIRANLARKNIIDFHKNWARGLAQLMKALERDGVPRQKLHGPADTAAWCREHLRASARLSPVAEPLVSNWLPIRALPDEVLFHDVSVPLDQIDQVARSLLYPHFRYFRLIGSFAEASDLQGNLPATIAMKEQYRISLDRFTAGSPPGLPGIEAKEARNSISNLLRQAWANRAKACGLLPYVTASGAVAWFPPKALIEADRVTFTDIAGKRRRKNVVGWSERRQLYWHLAMELKPVLGRIPRMVARTHVVFTTDGKTLVDNKDHMHAMRRRFCKSWWNDRWRDLLLAYATWLANGEDTIELPVGSNTAVKLGGSPLVMMAPISLNEKISEDETPAEMADELDLGEPDDDEADEDRAGEVDEIANLDGTP